MSRRNTVLYVQHAGALGGSTASLLYMIQAMGDSGFRPIVACIRPTQQVLEFYQRAGIETLAWPGLATFEHTTALWYPLSSPSAVVSLGKQMAAIRRSRHRMLGFLKQVDPALVHLNSVVLAPYVASVREAGLPLVWHVRESPVPGHVGARKWWVSDLLRANAESVIFISRHDQMAWMGEPRGTVVPNFVHFERFDRSLSRERARIDLGLDPNRPIVLFLGGTAAIKGFQVLVEAMAYVVRGLPGATLLCPGAQLRPSQAPLARVARFALPLVGSGTKGQLLMRRLEDLGIREAVRLLPFAKDVEKYLAASDVVVFPSIRPHFARPVIEAGAMARPVVASRIGGVEELVEHEKTGLLVEPGKAEDLAAAVLRIAGDSNLAQSLGEGGYERARRLFDARANGRAIAEKYEAQLKAGPKVRVEGGGTWADK